MKKNITDDDIIRVCGESRSMAQAASTLKIHFNTLRRHAIRLECYKPNIGLTGVKRYEFRKEHGFRIQDILNGEQPQYSTYKLKNKLLKENILENKCSVCGLDNMWNGIPINMELDHIDGNRTNHSLDNLRMICPNCHSQTDTYRSKNRHKA